LAVSPDSKRVVATDGIGNLSIHNAADGSELVRFLNLDPTLSPPTALNARTVWAASFFPDGRLLATGDRGGWLRIWNSETGELTTSIPVSLGNLNRTLAISPDGKLVAVSIDPFGEPDHLWVWNVENAAWVHKQATPNTVTSLAFTRDGRSLLGPQRTGLVSLWRVGAGGALSTERHIGPTGTGAKCAVFSADEKSFFAAGDNPTDGQLSQWDVETGEELWRSPHLEQGLEGVAVLGRDRVVTIGADQRTRIWQRRGVPKSR
jgi:WD40 repeat protein